MSLACATRLALCVAGAFTACAAACTDSSLYHSTQGPAEADRLALHGVACAEDPAAARFPVRVALVVDQAQGPLFAAYDPGGQRLRALGEFIQASLASPEVSLAVVGYHGTAGKIAPMDQAYTRSQSELLNALSVLANPRPCVAEGVCRSYLEGLRAARAVAEGDLAALPRGLSVLTQYVVILVNAGPHAPLAPATDCCKPDDTACLNGDASPSAACQVEIEQAEVFRLREAIVAGGAGGLTLHAVHLAADPDGAVNAAVETGMRGMAFAGQGTYQRFNDVNGLSAAALDLLNLRTALRVKQLLVANVNVRAGAAGPAADSDGDGLTDEEEALRGTSPTDRDTDHDGITDLVEVLTGLSPLAPDAPQACAMLEDPGGDRDLDGLTDCDEALLGTDPTLVDTDGDGLPDKLEVIAGTDYLHPDAEVDTDGDGRSNGTEVRDHTDPRSSNVGAQTGFEYRYEVADQGLQSLPAIPRLRQITGVTIESISAESSPGIGVLRYDAAGALSWQDAAEDAAGGAVGVTGGGSFTLPAASHAAAQGTAGRYVTVQVSPGELPLTGVVEQVRIIFREKHCIEYTVRNVTLMTTAAGADGLRGMNNLVLYLAEAAAGRLQSPGPFRMTQVVVQYIEPDTRSPSGAVLEVEDGEFVRPEIPAP